MAVPSTSAKRLVQNISFYPLPLEKHCRALGKMLVHIVHGVSDRFSAENAVSGLHYASE